MNSMDKTRDFLRSVGQPGGDAYDLPASAKRFADGGQYRFEVPGIVRVMWVLDLTARVYAVHWQFFEPPMPSQMTSEACCEVVLQGLST